MVNRGEWFLCKELWLFGVFLVLGGGGEKGDEEDEGGRVWSPLDEPKKRGRGVFSL